ncbi:MAG: hypothetical protein E6J04_12160 [Chloroflexi bacterium]|nr:MAG: hypothetical protein E6J04_12160 [Chloroflexota bacterium]HTD19245.1 hypothetical protein [Ktedonobacteraceae bacterium]
MERSQNLSCAAGGTGTCSQVICGRAFEERTHSHHAGLLRVRRSSTTPRDTTDCTRQMEVQTNVWDTQPMIEVEHLCLSFYGITLL